MNVEKIRNKLSHFYWVTWSDWSLDESHFPGNIIDNKKWDKYTDWIYSDTAYYKLQGLLCWFTQHKVINDHCCIPAHRFCVWCDRSFPNGFLEKLLTSSPRGWWQYMNERGLKWDWETNTVVRVDGQEGQGAGFQPTPEES